MIKLGGFGFIKDYDEIKRAGFDYAELDMPEIEALGDKEFDSFLAHGKRRHSPFPTERASCPPRSRPSLFRAFRYPVSKPTSAPPARNARKRA